MLATSRLIPKLGPFWCYAKQAPFEVFYGAYCKGVLQCVYIAMLAIEVWSHDTLFYGVISALVSDPKHR